MCGWDCNIICATLAVLSFLAAPGFSGVNTADRHVAVAVTRIYFNERNVQVLKFLGQLIQDFRVHHSLFDMLCSVNTWLIQNKQNFATYCASKSVSFKSLRNFLNFYQYIVVYPVKFPLNFLLFKWSTIELTIEVYIFPSKYISSLSSTTKYFTSYHQIFLLLHLYNEL